MNSLQEIVQYHVHDVKKHALACDRGTRALQPRPSLRSGGSWPLPPALLLLLLLPLHLQPQPASASTSTSASSPSSHSQSAPPPPSWAEMLEAAGVKESANYTSLDCARYDPTYQQIDADLAIHRALGTSLNATRYAAARHGTVAMRGLTVGFFGGAAYLLTPTDWRGLAHHAKLHLAWARMLLHVEEAFGAALPDVALVVSSSDTPRHVSPRLINASSPAGTPRPSGTGTGAFTPGPYPLAGIGKSDYWPDLLLIPNFHFHMKLYDNVSLGPIPEYTAETPWPQRKPILFGRFSRYRTNRADADASTLKRGVGGRRICYNRNQTCPGREHFIDRLAAKNKLRMDVKFSAKVSMMKHTAYKYLVNLDGQGISSRMEQLLPLGSVVFKEASGYYAYYYRTLLKHRVNMIEFWREVPEEVLDEMDWAEAHDNEARAIAAAGQALAERYLNANGRTCYWYRLLVALRTSLTYTPDLAQWPRAAPLRAVLAELRATAFGRQLWDQPWAP